MKHSVSENKPSRRAYEAPVVRVIDLATDEVLTTGCKLASGPTSGPTGGSPCLVAGCFSVGTS